MIAAKDFARLNKKTLDQIISESGRAAPQNPAVVQKAAEDIAKPPLNDEDQRFYDLGFRTLPNREGVASVANELVNRTREEEGI